MNELRNLTANELFQFILEEKPELVEFYSPELVEFYKQFGINAFEETKKDAQELILDYPNRDDEFYLNKINSTVYFDVDEDESHVLELYQDVVYIFLSDKITQIMNKSIRDFRNDQKDYPDPEYTRTIIK